MSERPSTAGNGFAARDGGHRGVLLGRRATGRAPQAIGRGLTRDQWRSGEVEGQQHRLTVGREQDVGRLDVQMHQPAIVGVLKGVGQDRPNPANRVDIADVGEMFAERPAWGQFGGGREGKAVERGEQIGRGPPRDRHRGRRLQHAVERGSAEVRHAEKSQVSIRDDLLEVKRHDIHVLQTRQREMLILIQRRDLDHDRAIGERPLAREERPPLRARPSSRTHPEVAELVAHVRKHDIRRGAEKAVAIEQQAELPPPLREPAEHFGGHGLLAGLLPEAGFLIDQPNRVLDRQLGMEPEKLLDAGRSPRSQAAAITSSCRATRTLTALVESVGRLGIGAPLARRRRAPPGRG